MCDAQPAAQPGSGVRQHRVRTWLIGLITLGLVMRVVLWLTYGPISYGDTGSYIRLGGALLGSVERGYDGTRVPGYPLFLALSGLDPQQAWAGQMILGVSISLMLFWIVWVVTGSGGLAFAVGVFYTLVPGQILFETAILTETLTAFFVVASLAAFCALDRAKTFFATASFAVLLGLAASGAGLTRPLFFPITLWYLPFVVWSASGSMRERLTLAVIYAIPPVALQGGWLWYMWTHWNVLSPTAMAGYSMVQHTGVFFEHLPDRYATIRDTYLAYREAQIAQRGVQTNAIWEAIPALEEATGLGFYTLARELNRISWELIRAHPGLYLRNVVEGWIAFWKAPVYWEPAAFSGPLVRGMFQVLALVGRVLSVTSNVLFLIMAIAAASSAAWRRRVVRQKPVLAAVGMILLISLVQTLLDHGDNPRFLVPMQSLVFLTVMYGFWAWRSGERSERVI